MALRFAPARGAASFALSTAIRGPTGAAATADVGTTTTLSAGSSATVINSGSTSAAILDFGIPRGADAGMKYSFESSTTMAAPASGGLRLNNATLASVTAMAVNATNADSVDVSDFVAQWDDSTNLVKGYVEIRKEGSGTVLAVFQISSVTDNTSWLQLALVYVSGSGSLSASDKVYLVPFITGNGANSPGIRQTYSSTTADADPGAGTFRLNNATPASATAAYLDNLDVGGSTVSTIIDLWDDSTNTTKGYLLIQKSMDSLVWASFAVTGSVVDGTGYRKLTLTSGAGSGAFTNGDVFSIVFLRAGDKGADGTIAGSTGASDNRLLRSDGVGGTTLQNSAITVDDSGNISGAGTFNGNTFTTGTYTLTGTAGKTFTFSNTLTLSGTDSSTLAIGAGGTLTGSSSSAIFYDNIPQNSKSAAYTTVLSDANKHIYHPSSDNNPRTFTIDSNANVAYPVGTCITFINEINTVTIAITSDTLTLNPAGTTGSRTLAANGMATAIKVASTKWVISGVGLS